MALKRDRINIGVVGPSAASETTRNGAGRADEAAASSHRGCSQRSEPASSHWRKRRRAIPCAADYGVAKGPTDDPCCPLCPLFVRQAARGVDRRPVPHLPRAGQAREVEGGRTYKGAGVSGASMILPGIQALLQDAQAGQFDIVLAEGLDRIPRDQADEATFYMQLCLSSRWRRARSASCMSVSRER